MQIHFTKIERLNGQYSNVVMVYTDERKMITKCLNQDELILLNDPLQEEYTLDYFSIKFTEECFNLPNVVEETVNPIQLSEHNGEVIII